MPKILVNVIKKGDGWKILYDSPVFVDMLTVMCDMYVEYSDPVIIKNGEGYPIMIERVEYMKMLDSQKIKDDEKVYHFKVKDGNKLVECSPEEATLTKVLPKDTDVSQLFYINNQVVMLDVRGE